MVYDPAKGSWVALKSQVDMEKQTISAPLSHLSTYGLMAGKPSPFGNWMLIGAILLGLLMAAGIVAFVLYRRRPLAAVMVESEVQSLPAPAAPLEGNITQDAPPAQKSQGIDPASEIPESGSMDKPPDP